MLLPKSMIVIAPNLIPACLALSIVVCPVTPNVAEAQTCAGPETVLRLFENSSFAAAGVLDDLMVAADSIGISTWDISDPKNPTRLGEWQAPRGYEWDWATSMHMDARGFAIMIPSLQVFDVRDPNQPKPLSTPSPAGVSWEEWKTWRGVAVSDQVFVNASSRNSPLRVLDLRDPFRPTWHYPNWSHPSSLSDITFAGDLLVVASRYQDIYLYDMSEPAVPRLVKEFPARFAYGSLAEITASHDLVLLTHFRTFFGPVETIGAIDLSDFENPRLIDLLGPLDWTFVNSIVFDGSIAYAVVRRFGNSSTSVFQVIDFSEPDTPVVLNEETVIGNCEVTFGGSAVVLTHYSSISIFDRSPPFELLSQIERGGEAREIAVSKTTGVVAGGRGGILLVDLAPATPEFLAQILIEGRAIYDIAASDNKAFALTDQDEIISIDISEPHQPAVLATIQTDTTATSLAVEGSTVAVTFGDYGRPVRLQIFDFSNPRLPIVKSMITTEDGIQRPSHVAIRNQLAYLAGTAYFFIIDLSDLAHPVILGSVNNIAGNKAVALVNNHAIVAGEGVTNGSTVIDVSNPAFPQIVSYLPTHRAMEVTSFGSTVAFASSNAVPKLSDFSDPTVPVSSRIPVLLRGVDAGALTADKWYLPAGPFLEVYTRSCEPPQAGFTWTGGGLELDFHNTSTGFMPNVAWDFGDGSTSPLFDARHRYSRTGEYTVTLEVGNDQGTDSHTETIHIRADIADPVRRSNGRHRP